MTYDENEIRKTFSVFCNKFMEVRILKDKFQASGYFSDADCLLKALKKYASREDLNYYMVFNEIDEACYSRLQKDCFIENTKEATADSNIIGRDWLMLDMDCQKPSGVSSTDAEVALAKEKAKSVYVYLKNNGFEEPVIAMSGNGIHLMYKIFLDNSPEKNDLLKNCLKALDVLFTDKDVKIDTQVFNASRITKLYGTMARKGSNTTDRPHRLSKILSVPDEIKVNDVNLLVALAKTLPEEPPKPAYQSYSNNNKSQFNLDEFLSKYGISVSQETSVGGMRKLILQECPFNSEHKGKDAAIFVQTNGAIGFKCLHSSCSGYTWQDVRKKFEPNAYDSTQRTAQKPNYQKPVHEEKAPNEPDFYTMDTIKEKDRSNMVTIKTGFKVIDDQIIGLNKQEVTCVSGFSGSGKSSWLSQLALNIIDQKYKVAIFSGELPEHKVQNWIHLQAAGKQHTKPSGNIHYYTVTPENRKLINAWMSNNLYVYNNRKGSEIEVVLCKMENCIKEQKVDVIILDNLMVMDLDGYQGDENKKQKRFAMTLCNYAKEMDVHILFVAHPKKPDGFLRKKDVSGSGHLTDAPDNVFLIHRVDEDFKQASKEFFRWKGDPELFLYDNVIEISKNRDLGVHDKLLGLYYENESKRFLNERFEIKHYDWEDNLEIALPFDLN